jgi:myosin heavy subunit
MIKGGLICLISGSLVLSGCQAPNGQGSSQGQTVVEGAGLGVLVGAIGGALLGGKQGAMYGAAIGGALGVAAGAYVAEQKKKYATIEQRIAGERQLVAQATATARSQTAASAAKLQLVKAQLAELSQMRGDRVQAQNTAATMLAGLQHQRAELEAQRKDLETRVKDQHAFIAETEQEIGTGDPAKTAQMAQWKADIPSMQVALADMSTQVSEVSMMETIVQRIRAS